MKNFLLFYPLAMVFAGAALSAQTIPNGDFENWARKVYFSEPTLFWTTNTQTYLSGARANVTQSTTAYAGTYALRLEAVPAGGHVAPGAAALGTPGQGGFTGGYPYAELPDTLSGFVKYNIAPGDSAFLLLFFKAGGATVAAVSKQFTGVQDTYAQFKLPISSILPLEPDTLLFLLATSTNFDNASAGNILYMDELHFTGASAPFPNGGFEDWTEVASEEPDGGWLTSNIFNITGQPSVTKSADAYSGNYAIRVENVLPFTIGGPPSSFALLGQLGAEGPSGGFPLFNTPKKLSGYYKYAPAGADSSIFLVQFSKWDPVAGQSDSIAALSFSLPAAAAYTLFELPFNVDWAEAPDTMLLGFAPSYLEDDSATVTVGSALQADALAIEFVSGVAFSLGEYISLISAFPNPVRDYLTLHFFVAGPTPLQVVVFDAAGKKQASYNLGIRNGEINFDLPVGGLFPGSYIYSIVTVKGAFNGKFTTF